MVHLSAKTEALARELAAARHVSVDDAVREALETHLQSHATPSAKPSPAQVRAEFEAYIAKLDALPVRDSRPPHEIIDEFNDIGI